MNISRPKRPVRGEGYHFGHDVYLEDRVDNDGVYSYWRYVDTDELISKSPSRRCTLCGDFPTKDGHDPCIANLPGVKFACCGHGKGNGYIAFDDGKIIRFDFLTEAPGLKYFTG